MAGAGRAPGLTWDLAEAAVSMRPGAAGEGAIRRLAVAFTDVIGVGLAGSQERVARLARAASGLETEQRPRQCVLGSRGAAARLDAAFLNGIACHALDFDDLIQPAGSHPSCHIVPGLLAAAHGQRISGRAFLEAYLVGIEVEARLGAALAPGTSAPWHLVGVVGPVAVAAAVARLLRCTPAQTAHAIGIAVSCASGVRANRSTMVKPVHAGLAAQNGLRAALLAQAGLTSRADAIECDKGLLDAFGRRPDLDMRFLREFGSPWQAGPAGGLVFKPFPCCAAAYPAISAGLSARHEIDPETIDSISVTTTRSVGEALAAPRASSSAEARLSLEYCLAATLAQGKVNLTTFGPEALEDRLVRALMGKMSVRIDGAWHPAKKFGVAVAIMLRDGQVIRRRECSDGEVNDCLSSEETLREKFLDCAGSVLGGKSADAYDHLMGVGEAEDIWDGMDAVLPQDAVPG